MEMISRFRGTENRDRLISAIRQQTIIHNNENLSVELADQAEILQFEPEAELIVQGGADNDIYFILAGRLSIVVNGREVAIRESGQHVGEMALIDPSAKRSASVVAIEQTVVAKISEVSFRPLADEYPRVWQLIATELAKRLQQRNRLVASTNPRPVLFIGSSKESLHIAEAIQSNLDHDDFLVRLWTDGVFGASQFPIIDLEKQVQEADFAALVLGRDDEVISRNQKSDAPRDNVIFELGLFMGALSHERTFMIIPRIPRRGDIKIPTDLLGLTSLDYRLENTDDFVSLLGPACEQLREIIHKMGVK